MTTPRPAVPARRTSSPPPPSDDAPRSTKSFTVGPSKPGRGERVVLYGQGGIGKSSLAALAPSPVFLNFDENPHLPDTARVVHGVESLADALSALRTPSLWTDAKTVVVDTMTAAQELAVAHTIATVPHEKGHKVKSIEGYGFGKGLRYLNDTLCEFLAAVDQHAAQGRHVIVVAHETTAKVPNPEGEDFIQFQPNVVQQGETCRFRDRLKGWCDHMLYVQYDRVVKDGKATGKGTRTIHCQESATFWAKSRTLRDSIPFDEGDTTVWDTMFNQEAAS